MKRTSRERLKYILDLLHDCVKQFSEVEQIELQWMFRGEMKRKKQKLVLEKVSFFSSKSAD